MGNYTFLKIFNVMAYFLFLGFHLKFWTNDGSIEKDNIPTKNSYITYITPADFTLYITSGLINVLFLGFIIYQFFDSANEVVIDGIQWDFIIIASLTSTFLSLWDLEYIFCTFVVSAVLGIQVSYLYYRIRQQFPAKNWADVLYIHAPLSIYHAWIVVITLTVLFAAVFPNPKEGHEPEILIRIAVGLAYICLELTAIFYVEAVGKEDILGALVISWSFLGICFRVEDLGFSIAALGLGIFTGIYAVSPLIRQCCRENRNYGESVSLLA
ncbi:hypothetical protein G9A89_005398 [Geosiphon pyriformis]|nr:hypothetical protein G9A89_005398 [Geosiphon pyriformis]